MDHDGPPVITAVTQRRLPWRLVMVLSIPVLFGLAFKDLPVRKVPAILNA